ncbi:MAG: pantothenate kinase [Synechococcales cyanobacterium]
MNSPADRPLPQWLAVVQGNSHQRRGWFQGSRLLHQEVWVGNPPVDWTQELWWLGVAGAAPSSARVITLPDVPLRNLYSSLGLDRAMGLWEATCRWGWPLLLVDAGTALTFTAGQAGAFAGGAILPGWACQARALHQFTAALPQVDPLPAAPPEGIPRWANTTAEAIRSGITYGLQATIRDFWQDWSRQYPQSQLVITGGDAPILLRGLGIPTVHHAPDLLLQGISRFRAQNIADFSQ